MLVLSYRHNPLCLFLDDLYVTPAKQQVFVPSVVLQCMLYHEYYYRYFVDGFCVSPPQPEIVMRAQMLEVSLLGVRTVVRLERDVWSMVK